VLLKKTSSYSAHRMDGDENLTTPPEHAAVEESSTGHWHIFSKVGL